MKKKSEKKTVKEVDSNIENIKTEESQPPRSSHFLHKFLGLCFLATAVFGVVCLYFPSLLPKCELLREILQYLFGKCVGLLPIVMGIIATATLADDDYSVWSAKNFGLFILILALNGIVHAFYVPVKQELYPESLLNGGGLFGGLIVLFLHKFLDNTTTIVVLAIGLSLGIFLVLPYIDLFHYFLSSLRLLRKSVSSFFSSSKHTDEDNIEDGDFDSEDNFGEENEEENNDIETDEFHPVCSANKTGIPSGEFLLNGKASGKKTDDAAHISAKEIIAQRTKNIFNKDSNSSGPKRDEHTVKNLYERKEFKDFTDGIRKESTIKRIITRASGNGVYDKGESAQQFKKDPVKIPEWQEEEAEKPKCTGWTLFSSSGWHDEGGDHGTGEIAEIIPLRRNPAVSADGNNKNDTKQTVSASDEKRIPISHYRKATQDDIATGERNPSVSQSVKPVKSSSQVSYRFPPRDLLDKPQHVRPESFDSDIKKQCTILEQTLRDFKVSARVVGVTRGPSVTRFEIEPSPGVKVSSVTNLADDIALKLATSGVRIEAPIPGKAAIGIEVPNIRNDAVFFREILEGKELMQYSDSPLCIGLGKDISGNVVTIDITKMPHLLVAGSTGSGKSVCINSLIAGILFKAHPEEVKLILVDPKVVELSLYEGIPHLLVPVVTDMKKAASALQWAVKEMERRYTLFAEKKVREINAYNLNTSPKLPFIVIIIDELSDLMMVARIDVEDAILRLAQKARAAGIHLILATQRPSVDVITGIIKANIPSRIAFAVSSQTDSRTILDTGGAEKLIGKGDMLYLPIGTNKPRRVQGAFVSDNELSKVVEFINKQSIPAEYSEEVTTQELSQNKTADVANVKNDGKDELFVEAVKLILDLGQASSSMLQRKFRIGYTRAARLVDSMEKMGIIGQAMGSKPRELIMSREEIEKILQE